MPEPKRVLLLATNAAGHDPFADAAVKLGLELIVGTEDGHGALRLDFNTRDSALRIVQFAMEHPVAAIVVADEKPLPVAARAASMLGLPFHPPKAGDAMRDRKRLDRRLHATGLEIAEPSAAQLGFAGIMTDGKLRVLGTFDHDAAPAHLSAQGQQRLPDLLRAVIKALSLSNGPVYVSATADLHAIASVSAVIPEKIASALRFRIPLVDDDISWEELLIRHALGIDISRAYRQK